MRHTTNQSLKRFLKLGLAIGKPTYHFHQTLTFPEKVHTLAEVKKPLKSFLDRLCKRFDAFVLYAIEEHQVGGLHVHMLICFYGDSLPYPDSHADRFGSAAFKIWNDINDGKCIRFANQTTRPEEIDPTYFIKTVSSLPRGTRKQREKANWFGYRGKKFLQANGQQVDQNRLSELAARYESNKETYRANSKKTRPKTATPYRQRVKLFYEEFDEPLIGGPENSLPVGNRKPDLKDLLSQVARFEPTETNEICLAC